jgi:uncharacterized membrane protein
MTEADQGRPGEEDEAASTATPPPARMVRLEKQAGWVVVASTATAVVYAWTAGPVNGKSLAISAVALGLAMAAVLGAAVWNGRRLVTAFAAMGAGVVIGYSFISIVCLAYGGFLLFRNTMIQRKLAASRPRRPPRSARSRSTTDAAATSDGGRRPSANRRYTPPKSKTTPRRGR